MERRQILPPKFQPEFLTNSKSLSASYRSFFIAFQVSPGQKQISISSVFYFWGCRIFSLKFGPNFRPPQNLSLHLIDNCLLLFRYLRVRNKSALPPFTILKGRQILPPKFQPKFLTESKSLYASHRSLFIAFQVSPGQKKTRISSCQ